MLALLNEFVYKYRENNTYIIQEKTALFMPITYRRKSTGANPPGFEL